MKATAGQHVLGVVLHVDRAVWTFRNSFEVLPQRGELLAERLAAEAVDAADVRRRLEGDGRDLVGVGVGRERRQEVAAAEG